MSLTVQTAAGMGVSVKGVSRTFSGGVTAVADLTLEVAGGEFLAVLGPSGCGKSTLLRMIAGLDHPDRGDITTASRQRIGYVFQDAHLLPWRNVIGNVSLPLELAGVAGPDRQARAMNIVEEVGLGDFARRYPAELSGGMRMRVSLARALVTEPGLLLMDEPFAALDEITRQKLDEMLRALWLRRGVTILFVTHSIAEATFLAQRAVVLTKRPARVVTDRRIELPRERKGEIRGEATFAGEMRMLYEALEEGMK